VTHNDKTDNLRDDIKSLVVAAEDVLAWIVPVRGEAAHIFAQFPQVARLAALVEKFKSRE
jgi:hypothetical protein